MSVFSDETLRLRRQAADCKATRDSAERGTEVWSLWDERYRSLTAACLEAATADLGILAEIS